MRELIHTARMTGLLYLSLAITGGIGFLLIRPQLFDADDPTATLTNLVEHASLARTGVALELLTVITQTAAAAWFYRLFRSADPLSATGIAAFGLVNAIAILVSAAMLATATETASNPVGDAVATTHLLYQVSDNLWGAGALFFGLWLIPMGTCVLRSGWMPRPLGWVLIVGGVGYLLSAFTAVLAPDSQATDALAYPASIGEFWMIAYLLIRGVRRQTPQDTPSNPRTPATPAA